MYIKPKKLRLSFDKPDIVKYNIGDEKSIYRALEDAGAEIPWTQILKDHETHTEALRSSSQKWSPYVIEPFLEEFAKNNKFSIIYLKPAGNKIWEHIYVNKNPKREIVIRQECKNGQEFTALFFLEHPSFKEAITLNTPPKSNFPRHWPPKHFVGCEKHINILESQWRKAFEAVNTTVNEARSKNNKSINQFANISLDDHKRRRLLCGLFARPKSGKSYCFNRLLLSGLISDSEEDLATIGPSATSNAIHTKGVTKLPIRAIYSEKQLAISLKDVENDQDSAPNQQVIILEFMYGTEPVITKVHLEQIVAQIKKINEQPHEKTAYIELLIPSPFLKSVNIELIDLPGFVDDKQNESAYINSTIAIYLNSIQEQCPLLDAVIFLTAGREVPESVYLDLYRCGYFTAKPTFLPKLIYLINSIEGLEKAEDYQNEKLENNIAKARDEVKQAFTSYISREENLVDGFYADYVSIIFERATATPFFRSTFRDFNTVSELESIFLEVRFHKLRCKMLELIKEELVNNIFIEKLQIISKTNGEKKKLYALLKNADKIKAKYNNRWLKLNEQKEYSISPNQYLSNKKSEDAVERSALAVKQRSKLYYWLQKQIKGYVKQLYEFSRGEKIKLIDELVQLNTDTYRTKADGSSPSEAFHLVNNYLNEANESVQKDSPRSYPLTSELCDAANRALSTTATSDFNTLDESLEYFLKERLSEGLKSLQSYTLALCLSKMKNAKNESETLQKKIIKYENLLRRLQLTYSFFKTSNGKKKELSGLSDKIQIKRHPAATKDKELLKELSANPEWPMYFEVSQGNGSHLKEISVEFNFDAKKIEIKHDLSDQVFLDLKQAGNYQDNLIHPIFIPSKLRGRSPEGTTDLEVVRPQLYKNKLGDFPESFVIPVVDRSEAERYWKYIQDNSILVDIMMVIDDSNSKQMPINIGRKRHIIKMVAEQVLKLDFYWVIDDDIKFFVETGELLYRAPCTIGKALHFAQRVLQQELIVEQYQNKAKDLFKKISSLHPAESMPLMLEFPSGDIFKNVITKNADGFRKLCEEQGFAQELRNIQEERLLRVGQVALYNINDRSSEKRNFLIKKENFSHINRGERYQVVLFNRVAMEGIDYMSKEDFFKPNSDSISPITSTKNDRKKMHAKIGSMHEDWYIIQQMKEKNRPGYLVFRYGFENYDRYSYPSLVHNVSKPVPKDKAISTAYSLDSDDDQPSTEEIDTEEMSDS